MNRAAGPAPERVKLQLSLPSIFTRQGRGQQSPALAMFTHHAELRAQRLQLSQDSQQGCGGCPGRGCCRKAPYENGKTRNTSRSNAPTYITAVTRITGKTYPPVFSRKTSFPARGNRSPSRAVVIRKKQLCAGQEPRQRLGRIEFYFCFILNFISKKGAKNGDEMNDQTGTK